MPRLQVDPVVSAVVYYASSLYYKAEKDFAEFYKSSLLYLAFVSSDTLEQEYKLVRPAPYLRRVCCVSIVPTDLKLLNHRFPTQSLRKTQCV